MKLRNRLLCYTAAVALTAGAAFAAIDGNQLADDYLAQGYSFVEVKVGPTQTKVEAVKGTTKVEVVYDNETQAIIDQETELADDDEIGLTGKEVKSVDSDFEDHDDDDEDEDHDEDEDDDHDDDDEDDHDDDHDDSDHDGDGDGNSGHGGDEGGESEND